MRKRGVAMLEANSTAANVGHVSSVGKHSSWLVSVIRRSISARHLCRRNPYMRIAEIFYSIQGEGSLIGMPSVFVRTSGCNLRCSWCDTKYASWHPEGETQTVDAIVDDVCGYPTEYVVL